MQEMFRSIAGITLIAAATLGAGATEAATHTTCHPQTVNSAPGNHGDEGDLLCVHGEPAALKLELRGTPVSAALDELLTAYGVSYTSSIPLSETLDGTYAGSLRHVVSRLLDGYNYIIKRNGLNLHVVILAKKGERAVAAPAEIQVSERIERPVHGSRGH
jgi:hypothetical protein